MTEILHVDGFYYFECPHCKNMVQVKDNEVNCTIFRCGVFKQGGGNIPPHTKKEECDRLFDEGKIYGCSKPFKFDKRTVEIIGYL